MEWTSVSNRPLVFVMSRVKPGVSTDVHSLDVQQRVQLTPDRPRSSVHSQSQVDNRRSAVEFNKFLSPPAANG